MDTTHTETTPIAGIVHGLLITAVAVIWVALHLEGYGEVGAGVAVLVWLGWALRWLYRRTEEAQPSTPEEYESHQVLAMRLPCGACGQLRLLEELRPHDLHWRVCRDGLCRRQSHEQDVA